jgi:hypothetical protein
MSRTHLTSLDTATGLPRSPDRRAWFQSAGKGLHAAALTWLLGRDLFNSPAAIAAEPVPGDSVRRRFDLKPRQPHFEPKAKSVIHLFMNGGPSQMDLFDPKPELDKRHGESYFEKIAGEVENPGAAGALMRCPFKFSRHGESGTWVSDVMPHLATCVDRIAILKSMYTVNLTHEPALFIIHGGGMVPGLPSMGAWVTYGLGSENENLPGYVVMLDPDGTLVGGPPCWGAGYFPPVYQGTLFRPGPVPVLDLLPSDGRTRRRQRSSLDLMNRLNELRRRPGDEQLLSRLATYELAYRMQSHAPEAVDISDETRETEELYGLDDPRTEEFGTRCLLARRLVERGVRFVQLYCGGGPGNLTWDGHGDIEENHLRMAGQSDKPVAGLLKDLKRRGLLEKTLVIWGGEFGRTPMSQGETGRDHSPFGFSMWLAGGGIQGGRMVGQTDEIGLRAVEQPYHVRDLHATILHQLGLDQEELTFLHNGREEMLTDIGGQLIEGIL